MTIRAERFILLKRPMGVPDESDFGLETVTLSSELKEDQLRLHGLY